MSGFTMMCSGTPSAVDPGCPCKCCGFDSGKPATSQDAEQRLMMDLVTVEDVFFPSKGWLSSILCTKSFFMFRQDPIAGSTAGSRNPARSCDGWELAANGLGGTSTPGMASSAFGSTGVAGAACEGLAVLAPRAI